jgi:site-specific recombinase XerD
MGSDRRTTAASDSRNINWRQVAIVTEIARSERQPGSRILRGPQNAFNALLDWRAESLYATEADFLFPSIRLNGSRPLSPDSLLKRSIRPALVQAGIEGKQIGWHSFRHSLATNLRALGVDIKVAQELLRHASSRTTLDIYTRAVSQQKRDANKKVVEMMLPKEMKKFQHPSAPSMELEDARWCR